MKISDWNSPAILYLADINGKAKFGIGKSWVAQEKKLKVDHGNVPVQLLMKTEFEHFWQAELVEQLMKLKLKPFIEPGLHEWLRDKCPLQHVLECCRQIQGLLKKRYAHHEHIHKRGNQRWLFYKRVYVTLQSQLEN